MLLVKFLSVSILAMDSKDKKLSSKDVAKKDTDSVLEDANQKEGVGAEKEEEAKSEIPKIEIGVEGVRIEEDGKIVAGETDNSDNSSDKPQDEKETKVVEDENKSAGPKASKDSE